MHTYNHIQTAAESVSDRATRNAIESIIASAHDNAKGDDEAFVGSIGVMLAYMDWSDDVRSFFDQQGITY